MTFDDQPKSLRDRAACEARRSRLTEQHVAPLADFVHQLRTHHPDAIIPDFDPWDGGVAAELLYLLEAPGPKAGESGFVSRNNPDETARNFFELNQQAGIARRRTATWNVVPWYIGTGTRIRAATSRDIRQGLSPLLDLLALLPNLRAIVLIGRKAARTAPEISRLRPALRVFQSPHPSPMYCNRAPGNREIILNVLKDVARFIGPAE